MFEWIIMRQKDGRWVIHRRLESTVTEEEAREVAKDVAVRYFTRVSLLGADQYQVVEAFHVLASGVGSMPSRG